jgi:branched-chain amino acid transport system ATP-binding protein
MEALRIIAEEHQNLWRMATAMDQVAQEIGRGEPMDAAFFSSIFDYIEHFVAQAHDQKEDDFLFPALRRRSQESHAILDRLQAEHATGAQTLTDMRAGLAAADSGGKALADFLEAARQYSRDIKGHIHAEDKHVTPLARKLLTPEDWAEIDHGFMDDPRFGAAARAHFRELFHHIVSLAPESVGLGAHSGGRLQPGTAPATGEVLLSVSDMETCYGRITALKGISLEVKKGELVALVGANGAGKSTFLRTLSGIQPMSAGRIQFDGEDISRLAADMRVRRGICQSPEGRQVFGPLSIEDNLRLGAYTQAKSRVGDDLERIYAMFPILKEKRALPAGTLSGGQQQMLAIGRALMGRPRLLLLDEPSMGLAPLLVEEVFNVVQALKAQGITIMLVEQNAFAALAIADRGYVLETGAITLSGTGQELLKNEQVRTAYLGM